MVEYNNENGTICDDYYAGWDTITPAKLCEFLGQPGPAVWYSQRLGNAPPEVGTINQPNTRIWLDDFYCNGWESNVDECVHRRPGRHNCYPSENIGVYCNYAPGSGSAPEYQGIRLSGGASSNTGVVEVAYDGIWGTICDDYMDTRTAETLCRILGRESEGAMWYNPHSAPSSLSYESTSTDKIWLDNFYCLGSESNPDDCRHNPVGEHNCAAYENVILVCPVRQTTTVRPSSTTAVPTTTTTEAVTTPSTTTRPSTTTTTVTTTTQAATTQAPSDDCGLNKYNNIVSFGAGVVGGSESLINQYPWIVRLLVRSGSSWYYICGGTIISENYVLTAAHCVDGGYDEYAVVVGDHSSRVTESSQQTVAVSRVISHENYNGNSMVNDFALLKLQSKSHNSYDCP